MNPFELLGVPPDADERTIKRAYARLLKSTRPDDDPDAFQRLHDAYELALAAREEPPPLPGLTWEAIPAPGAPPETCRVSFAQHAENASVPVAQPVLAPREAFVFEHFARELVARASEGSLDDLRAWLESHPALYELTVKNLVRELLAARLRDEGLIELSELSLELVAEFFDLHLSSSGGRRSVGRAILLEDTRAFGVPERGPIRQLKRAFSLPQVLFALLLPGRGPRSGALAVQFVRGWGGLPPGLDPQQVEFFSRLVAPGRIVREHVLLLVALLVLAPVFALAPWWLVGTYHAQVHPVLGFMMFLSAIGGLAVAAVLVVGSAWLWRQLWSGLKPLAGLYPLVRRLPVAFALLAPALSKLGAAPQLIACALLALYWWRVIPVAGLLTSSSLAFAVALAPDPPIHPLALGAASVPLLLLAMDALYAKVHRITLREAFGNRWTLVGALGSVVLAVLVLTRLNG